MKSNLKVGMSFRVFEVNDRIYDPYFIGKWFAEANDQYHNNNYGVNTPYYEDVDDYFHVGIDGRNEAREVGRLTITKLK